MMTRKVYPSDLSDREWRMIEPLLPSAKGIGHPRTVDLREIINGIFYVLQEGCSWRALPHDLPPWQTVYKYFRHWQHLGVWQKIHKFRLQVKKPTNLDNFRYVRTKYPLCPYSSCPYVLNCKI